MFRYIISKLVILIITLWVIITVAFFLMKVVPGNPFVGDRALSETELHNLMHNYNLDKPLLWQYGNYLYSIAHGDFGPSYKMRDFTVTELIKVSAPVSIELTLIAIIIAVFFGLVVGSFSALNQNTKIDYLLMTIAMIGIIFPSYAIAPILALVFGVYLKILPVAGWNGISSVILPVLALALPSIAYISRLVRGSMLEILNTNYVRTAYAKGLSNRKIITRHVLKPVLIPLVSYLGPTIAALMTGSVVVETIFDLPGLGRYVVQASLNRDYNVVLGIVIFYATLVLVLNFISDILYSLLDPRVKL